MKLALSLIRTRPSTFKGCTPPTPAERMARVSPRHAEEMRLRENAGAAAPRVRIVDGRAVMVALPGSVNALPKDAKAEGQA